MALRPGIGGFQGPDNDRKSDITFGAPYARSLPAGWTLTLDPEIDFADPSVELGFQNLLGLNHPLGESWTVLAELTASRTPDRYQSTAYTAVTGVDYTPRDDQTLHLDVGIIVALNELTPYPDFYMGFSKRF